MTKINCPIDFKLGMMIPVIVRYNIESVATILFDQKGRTPNLKHVDNDNLKYIFFMK